MCCVRQRTSDDGVIRLAYSICERAHRRGGGGFVGSGHHHRVCTNMYTVKEGGKRFIRITVHEGRVIHEVAVWHDGTEHKLRVAFSEKAETRKTQRYLCSHFALFE